MNVERDIDVVIVTYNSSRTLPRAMSSIRQSALVHRVIVVDNCSGDDSAELAATSGADEVVRNGRNLGFAAGVNQGIERSSERFVLLLNPDAFVSPVALIGLRHMLLRNPMAAMVGPSLLSGGERVLGARRESQPWPRIVRCYPLLRRVTARLATEEYASRAEWLASPEPRHVDYVWGAACLLRRDFLMRVGGLDERYFMYCEDEDLGRTARTLGYSVLLAPSLVVRHVGGASSASVASRAEAWQVVSTYLLFRKWRGGLTGSGYLGLVCLGYVLQLLTDRVRRRDSSAVHRTQVLRHVFAGLSAPPGGIKGTSRGADGRGSKS